MRFRLRPLLGLALLGVAGGILGGLIGCGGSPKAAVVEPAKNMYVVQNSSANGIEADAVLAISTTSTGAAMPTATLQLPSALVAFGVATGPDGEIYVGGPTSNTTGEVLVYAAGATGAATPTATLTGGAMGTFTIPLYMTVSSKGQLVVFSADGSIETFAKGATSAAAPVQYLTYPISTGDYFAGIGMDDAGEIFVSDEKAGVIDVFAAGANGADAPVRSISATPAGSFSDLYGLTVNGAGDLTVVNYNSADDPFGDVVATPASMKGARARFMHREMGAKGVGPMDDPTLLPTSIMTFAAGASGTATPSRTLSGPLTAINEPEGVALDRLGNFYYEDYEGGSLTLMVFPPAATGNVAPSASITSTAFTVSYFGAISAY